MSRTQPLKASQLKRSAGLFAALGDETRLALLARLNTRDALSITALAAGSPLTRQAVTKHLHVLSKAGLARHSRLGREQLWQLDPAKLSEARQCLDRIAAVWDGALSRLKAAVE